MIRFSAAALAQGELQGRVLADSNRRLVVNAVVSLPRLKRVVPSDSLGRYRLTNVPSGEHLVVTRAAGFRPDSAVTELDADETIGGDVLLERSLATLAEVHVVGATAPVMRGRMAGYDDRKAAGIGQFIDRQLLDDDKGTRLGDVLSGAVPGTPIHRGTGARAWAATGRGNTNAPCGLCRVAKADILDRYDSASGAPLAGYKDIYLDRAVVYSAGPANRRRCSPSTASIRGTSRASRSSRVRHRYRLSSSEPAMGVV